jgi:hypothetical protein
MKKTKAVTAAKSVEQIHSEFFEQFLKQDDRSAVILAGALIDLLLGALLQKAFLPSPTEKDSLLGERGVLSSLYAKSIACQRLGLIDADMHRAISLIRDIRNTYAHRLEYSDLSSELYAAKIKEAYALFSWYGPFVEAGKQIFGGEETGSMQFRLTSVLVASRLKQAIEEQNPLHSAKPKTLVSEKWTMFREFGWLSGATP